ncbi:NUDIX hydrolase [Euzebya tangerina]|uniref:NUDIX hydrolase n=1 Tax=Euzebya tangerina TaxID=591198 RepID=UPI0013C2FC30|nr:NUDIX domain-containing protein [Euzebya tangerina]
MTPEPPLPIVGVGAIVVRDGRLLVIKRGQPPFEGHWSVPGGRLEFGETLAEGAVRELEEETGLRGTAEGLCGIAERFSDRGHIVIHDYWVDVPDGQPAVAGDDAADVAWVDRSELAALARVPRLDEFLESNGVLDRMR